jgi:hypothetical protein
MRVAQPVIASNFNPLEKPTISAHVNRAELEAKVQAMYRDVAENPHGEFHFEMGRAMTERSVTCLATWIESLPRDQIVPKDIPAHWVDLHSGEIGRKKLSRAKLAEYFAQRQTARVALEACGSAHHWARVLSGLGHQVELLPPAQVRPFVRSHKDDAADARAIWLAAYQTRRRHASDPWPWSSTPGPATAEAALQD